MNTKISVVLTALLLLSACGGGSSSSENTPVAPPSPPPSTTPPLDDMLSISNTVIIAGDSIALWAKNSDQISTILWSQESGETINFHGKRNKLIGFDIPSAGSYQFSANIVMQDGRETSQVIDFTATEQLGEKLTARLDHTAPEMSQISLYAIPSEIDNSTITWSQIEGPEVVLDAHNRSLIFKAPEVEKDTFLKFRATTNSSSGEQLEDDVYVLVENIAYDDENIINGNFQRSPFAKMHPYKDSPLKQVLANCVASNTQTTPCLLGTVPLIAHTSNDPTLEQVMERVVVSHDWMGKRFEEYLKTYDTHGDFKKLLRAVTAVVISPQIRPSYYHVATGAIYLNPDFLWLTPDERDTVYVVPDPRSEYGNTFNFRFTWRKVNTNTTECEQNTSCHAFIFSHKKLRESRSLSDIKYMMAYLLYHELAHANDYQPPSDWVNLDMDKSLQFISQLKQYSGSSNFNGIHPLASDELKELAKVEFSGANPTSIQNNYQPTDIVHFFEPDSATTFYSYAFPSEDFAETFEHSMMQYRYGIMTDVAITNSPSNPSSANDYVLTWGQRGRIGEPRIKNRVRYVLEWVYPEVSIDDVIESIKPAESLAEGQGWLDSLAANKKANSSSSKQNLNTIDQFNLMRSLHMRHLSSASK